MSKHHLNSRQPILDKIVFFCAVIRTGSFKAASNEQGLSPAAGSRWVKELEEIIGVELIKRSTRQLVATQAGQKLYQRFNGLLPDINTAIEEVQNLAETLQGEIRISSTPLFAKQYLTDIISRYMQLHPKVDFKLFIEAGDFDALNIDFAFRANASYVGEQQIDSLLVKRHLLSEPLYLCASPSYLQSFGPPDNPEQLKSHRCLYARTLLGGNRWCFELDGRPTIVTIKDALECDNSEILLDFSLRGAGIAYLPESIVKEHIQNQNLISVLDNYLCATFDINMYYRPRKPMPERCSQFKSFLIEHISYQPGR
ncbi:LysR family transcriptional regulator [Vibrio sp. DW001]|uniref:LysR family transcriptional regulator n=1 Tax=Vibrio sp. DW001 TaxID=2912315 RepID=UPI0023B1BBBC|nr:LysR family transcriptional regulator [Vibrio sp. DW001]WED26337.1 LysR family transcriptional regulator [Vibrio sp. DW001]